VKITIPFLKLVLSLINYQKKGSKNGALQSLKY
jgi:hypothetical protein